VTDAETHHQHRRLAAHLKELRQVAGLSAAAVGQASGWSQSKVSKMENGRTALVVSDVERWLDAVGADDETRGEVVGLAREAGIRVRPWRHADRPGAADQEARGRRDAAAVGIAVYQSEVVPGLLQTPEYARRLLEVHSLMSRDEIPAAVLARMNRQTVLFDETTQFDLVITETALRWRPGSVSVTLAQLDRIEALAALPNVRIGVISRERQERREARPLHSFVLLRHVDSPAVVEIETLTAEQQLTDPADVAHYEQFLVEQQALAAHGAELVELLDSVREELRQLPGPR